MCRSTYIFTEYLKDQEFECLSRYFSNILSLEKPFYNLPLIIGITRIARDIVALNLNRREHHSKLRRPRPKTSENDFNTCAAIYHLPAELKNPLYNLSCNLNLKTLFIVIQNTHNFHKVDVDFNDAFHG